jgi:hypothetical protein
MPRIELIPNGWEHSKEKERGDGSPTVDVCAPCGVDFVEGEKPPAELKSYQDATVGETECAHPPFEEQSPPYKCECCGEELFGVDN